VLCCTPRGRAGFSGSGKNLAAAKPGKIRADNVRPASPLCGVPLRPLSLYFRGFAKQQEKTGSTTLYILSVAGAAFLALFSVNATFCGPL
jgi:hypothetical protein